MTATQMIPAVGTDCAVRFETIEIKCRVLDVKTAWGKVRLLITPFVGRGEQWVELNRVTTVDRTIKVSQNASQYEIDLAQANV